MYETEIWYPEVTYDADFVYAIKILVNRQNLSKSMSHHFEDKENMKLPISW